jgi:predicted nucleic acid-binding Zn ribbon protein
MKNKRNRKNKEFVPLGSVLPNVMGTLRTGGDERLLQVWELWDDAVGEMIAYNAQPLAFKGKLLLVEVNSSAWLHELQFLKDDMIRNLNNALGRELISEIKFKIGSFR